jgi:hypothetical protein
LCHFHKENLLSAKSYTKGLDASSYSVEGQACWVPSYSPLFNVDFSIKETAAGNEGGFYADIDFDD